MCHVLIGGGKLTQRYLDNGMLNEAGTFLFLCFGPAILLDCRHTREKVLGYLNGVKGLSCCGR
jgi:hypothetical protein